MSARPFGQQGTPGTYRFIEGLSKYFVTRCFSPPPTKDAVHQCHKVSLIPVTGFSRQDLVAAVPAISAFEPDIVYIFAAPRWHEACELIKNVLPESKVILDIKTPLLVKSVNEREEIQQGGASAAPLVDAILALSLESARSWMPGAVISPIVYPLAIDASVLGSFAKKRCSEGKPHVYRLVFAGTLASRREPRRLIGGFAEFSRRTTSRAELHIYGDGKERSELVREVARLGLKEQVQFFGMVSQEELFRTLPDYDIGIGWVPREVYEHSPSLKVLEYMAAGLPVLATATQAHRDLLRAGFKLQLCEDTEHGVAEGLERLIDKELLQRHKKLNQEAVAQRDYDVVVREHVVPAIQRLAGRQVVRPCVMRSEDQENVKKNGLRMLLVCRDLAAGKGGAERVAAELAEEMVTRRHTIYLAYEGRGEPAYAVSPEVILVPFKQARDLQPIATNCSIDCMVVLYFDRPSLVDFSRIAYLEGIPLVVQECTNPDRLRSHKWAGKYSSGQRAAWEREVVTAGATRIRLTMPSYARSFQRYQGGQIRSFSNSVKRVKCGANPGKRIGGEFIILVVNGFKRNKNPSDLIKAFACVANRFPDWRLRVVGKTPTAEELRARGIDELLTQFNLWKRVEIRESVDNIEAEYAKSHLHVIASLSEGCPTVVLEAMAAGLPSIGFEDCPGTNELIRHERNGLLADAGNRVSGLADALGRLMSGEEFRSMLGAQAKADSIQFEPKRIFDQWERLLLEAAGYKGEPQRLFNEQCAIDLERALHARRMRAQVATR